MGRAGRVGVVALAFATSVVAGAPAQAAASAEAGWWTTAPVAVAPDAPDDGLVVQGGPDPGQPFSYAAVSYELGVGEVPTSLTLIIAPGAVSTADAVLTLCLLTETFGPEQGGPMTNAPSFDCAAQATASPTADGTSYVFDVSGLYGSGRLALAVLPAAATDRVVLAQPTPDGLRTVTSTPGASEPGPPASSFAPRSTTPAFGDPVPVAPAPAGIPGVSEPAIADAPAPGPATANPAVSAEGFRSAPASGDDDSLVSAAIFGVLLVVAAALWVFAGAREEVIPLT
jgi:hypothetical protein